MSRTPKQPPPSGSPHQDPCADATRTRIAHGLAQHPPPPLEDFVVATYFLQLRSWTLSQAAREISYHATSGTRDVPEGSLLAECTGKAVGVEAFDTSQRTGLVHMAYPLKMMLQPDGHLTSTDLLHTTAGAILFDIYENVDVQFVNLHLPNSILRTFPGPAHGPTGVRRRTAFADTEPAFGTILKPTAGITPEQVGALVAEAAECPLFLFVKEDENLYPNLAYSPVSERTRRAAESIRNARERRGAKGLIFAPHITGAPHEILATLEAVIAAGATGVMFSESFAGGTVRMVREATREMDQPPAIYGHNAGIGVKTRGGIWREVLDLLARLDGIDFRQTAPVLAGDPFIFPCGEEWRASEDTLTRPIDGIAPVMIARAGGLDQGNIILNLQDAERRGLTSQVLFLAGSAINSIKNKEGKPDPKRGAEAMQQALEIHRSGELNNVPAASHQTELIAVAERHQCHALRDALRQRYPHLQ